MDIYPGSLRPFERNVLQPGFGVHYGSNVLQCLIDDSSPGIDLLVRESIQNSLDATEEGVPSVHVEFNYLDFQLTSLAGILDSETVARLQSLHGDRNLSLYIRDQGSVGLSGPNSFGGSSREDYGNFLKLCFSVGLKQTKAGSGGSWGFGKSIFYRISHAPVLYYSRFAQNGVYVERLIFCLIEDQDNKLERILNEGAGLAWWGEFDELTTSIVPCESPEKIGAVLAKLGLPRYSGVETGTLVFLPVLRKGQIPKSPSEAEATLAPDWIATDQAENDTTTYKRYTSVAIQRWYSPRLEGGGYTGGPILEAYVNGVRVGGNDDPILPFYSLIQTLYSCASNKKMIELAPNYKVALIPMQLRGTFVDGNSSPGVLAVARLPVGHALLNGIGNGYPDPSIQVFNFADSEECRIRPIIAMVRKPGMIVAYRNSGEWIDDISADLEGHLLSGVFVLRSEARLASQYPDEVLEEYIRHREPPAHNEWLDGRSPAGTPLNLLRRLKTSLAKGINRTYYSKSSALTDNRPAIFGDEIGRRYFPSGFKLSSKAKALSQIKWHCPDHPHILKTSPGVCSNCGANLEQRRAVKSGSPERAKFVVLEQRFPSSGTIMVDAEVFGGETETASLEVLVASDRAAMGMQAWKDTIGTRFPIQLSDVRAMEYQILTQSEPRRKWQDISDGPTPSTSLKTTDHIRISLSPGAQIAFFNFLTPNVVLRITIVLQIIREGIHPVLNFQEAPDAEIHL